jgi:hypothetical protein
VRYGLSCVGCRAALMVAMVIVGMSNLTWTLILSGFVVVYKLAPAASIRRAFLLSGAIGVLGVVYALMTSGRHGGLLASDAGAFWALRSVLARRVSLDRLSRRAKEQGVCDVRHDHCPSDGQEVSDWRQ